MRSSALFFFALTMRTQALALPRRSAVQKSVSLRLSPQTIPLEARRGVTCAMAISGGAVKPKFSLKSLWGVLGVSPSLILHKS